mmetsp:Transcript_115280/g.366512  ORF Transcript_115280/g.366512 Transcript_115280/m.366512 type:complete len:121 (+) Transcript_115280:1295-1657(+)
MASGSLQGWLADAVGLDTLGDEDAEGLPKQKAQSITPQHILCDACCPMGRPCCEFMFGSSQMVTYACCGGFCMLASYLTLLACLPWGVHVGKVACRCDAHEVLPHASIASLSALLSLACA